MAYLLHPSSFTAPSAQGAMDGESPTGIGLFGSVRSLLQGIQSALHAEPTRVAEDSAGRPTSNLSASEGAGEVAPSRSSAAALPALSFPQTSTKDRSRPAQTSSAATRPVQGRGTATKAVAAMRPTVTSRPTDATASDADLYRRAVDFTDVEEVLRCPLPPVKGCPTPCAYGDSFSKLTRPASTVAPPNPSTSHPSSSTLHQPTASPTPPLTFGCIAADPDSGISIYSTPVEECPMHLMRAYAILPCAPREVLQYMDNDVRPMWDSYIRRSALLRELPSPELASKAAATYQLSSSIRTAGVGVGRRSSTSLSAQAQQQTATSALSGDTPASTLGSTAASPAAGSGAFSYQPGQRRVAIHYLETRSPVPFVQDRDFELVVAEEVLSNGTAYSKALSTPFGYHMPLDPQQSRYVRAVVLLSGLMARPLDPATVEKALPPLLRRHRASFAAALKRKGASKLSLTPPQPSVQPPVEYCVLEYIGLVHPMGMLPAVLVNIVISAQLNAMRKMQTFIARHPMSTLRPRSSTSGLDGRVGLQATLPPLKELSAALRASPSANAPQSEVALPGAVAQESLPGDGTPEKKEGTSDVLPKKAATEKSTSEQREKTQESKGGAASGEGKPASPQRGVSRPWWRWRPGQLVSRL